MYAFNFIEQNEIEIELESVTKIDTSGVFLSVKKTWIFLLMRQLGFFASLQKCIDKMLVKGVSLTVRSLRW